jgi:hypothetical protein
MNYTAEECRERARLKTGKATLDPRNKQRLLNAAEAWLLLATRIDELDGETDACVKTLTPSQT